MDLKFLILHLKLFFKIIFFIIEAPKFTRQLKSEYKVDAGETILMDCVVGGEPEPDVDWYINGQMVRDEGRYVHQSFICAFICSLFK